MSHGYISKPCRKNCTRHPQCVADREKAARICPICKKPLGFNSWYGNHEDRYIEGVASYHQGCEASLPNNQHAYNVAMFGKPAADAARAKRIDAKGAAAARKVLNHFFFGG